MSIPHDLEHFCNAAFMALNYEGATLENCFRSANRELQPQARASLVKFLDELAEKNVNMLELRSKLDSWADRFGISVDGDIKQWLLSARSTLVELPPA